MKKKILAVLTLSVLGSALLLGGCSVSDVTDRITDRLSAETESVSVNTTPGLDTFQITCRFYDVSGARLKGATVTIFDGSNQLFSGKTNDAGVLDACSLPTGKDITFTVTDSSNNTIAKSDVHYESAGEFTENVIKPAKKGDSVQTVQIAPDSIAVIASMYIDESQRILTSSVAKNISSIQAQQKSSEADAAADSGNADAQKNADAANANKATDAANANANKAANAANANANKAADAANANANKTADAANANANNN